MSWNKKNAEDVYDVIEKEYGAPFGPIWPLHDAAFIIAKLLDAPGYRNTLKNFLSMRIQKDANGKKLIQACVESVICAKCKNTFINTDWQICMQCKSTPEGKKLATVLAQERLKETNLIKFGHVSAFHGSNNKKKLDTWKRNGGHPQQRLDVRRKTARTCKRRYGGSNPMCSQIVRDKIVATNRLRRGVDYASQDICVKQKIRITNIKEYGARVAWLGNTPKAIEARRKKGKTAFYVKEEIIEGKLFQGQGYELLFARFLIENFDVKPETLKGQFELDSHCLFSLSYKTYHSDFRLIRPGQQDVVFDVKSDFTMLDGMYGKALKANRRIQREMNALSKNKDWIFRFVVFNPRKQLHVVMPDSWYTWTKNKVINYVCTATK